MWASSDTSNNGDSIPTTSESLRAELYFPYMQLPDPAMLLSWNGTGVMVRYDQSAANIGDSLRVGNQGDRRRVRDLQDANDGANYFRFTCLAAVFHVCTRHFRSLALALASVGIYGVVSYLAGQRTQEIGIRMALGAKQRDVLLMVLRDGMKLTLAGVIIGCMATLGLT